MHDDNKNAPNETMDTYAHHEHDERKYFYGYGGREVNRTPTSWPANTSPEKTPEPSKDTYTLGASRLLIEGIVAQLLNRGVSGDDLVVALSDKVAVMYAGMIKDLNEAVRRADEAEAKCRNLEGADGDSMASRNASPLASLERQSLRDKLREAQKAHARTQSILDALIFDTFNKR